MKAKPIQKAGLPVDRQALQALTIGPTALRILTSKSPETIGPSVQPRKPPVRPFAALATAVAAAK